MFADSKWVPDMKICEQIVNSFKKISDPKYSKEGTQV
jgi:hypothetical protein